MKPSLSLWISCAALRRQRGRLKKAVVWSVVAMMLCWNSGSALAVSMVYQWTLTGVDGTLYNNSVPSAFSGQTVVFSLKGNTDDIDGSSSPSYSNIFSTGTVSIGALSGVFSSQGNIFSFAGFPDSGEFTIALNPAGTNNPNSATFGLSFGSSSYDLTPTGPITGGDAYLGFSGIELITNSGALTGIDITNFTGGSFFAFEARPRLGVTTPNDGNPTDEFVDFGHVLVNGGSASRIVRATNVGEADGLVGAWSAPTPGSPFSPTNSAAFPTTDPGDIVVGEFRDRSYSYSATNIGEQTGNITITHTGHDDDTVSLTLRGTGVMPVLATSDIVSGNTEVRQGTTITLAEATITNNGNGNLAGTVSGNTVGQDNGTGDLLLSHSETGDAGTVNRIFSSSNRLRDLSSTTFGLPDDTSGNQTAGSTEVTYTLSVADYTALGSQTTVTLTAQNGNTGAGVLNGSSQVLSATATVVGPSLMATYNDALSAPADGAPVSTADGSNDIVFADTKIGQSSQVTVDLTNLGVGSTGSLTDLTLAINGGGLGSDFTAELIGSGALSNDGELMEMVLTFSPTATGNLTGSFLLETDQGTFLGGNGLDFLFNLSGLAIEVPEPATILLWSGLGVALVAFGLRRRRRG